MLDVPRELIWFVSGLLAARRREIGTRKGTRRLGCYRQALFALAWFRDTGDIPRLGRAVGLPQPTAYPYLDKVSGVLPGNGHDLAAARENVLACCGRSWMPCRCWPIRATKVLVMVSTSR